MLTHFAQAKENTVHNCECRNMICEMNVKTTHDETNNGLAKQSENHRVLRAKVVDDEGTDQRARDVEQIDNNIPAKDNCERRCRTLHTALQSDLPQPFIKQIKLLTC